MKFNINFNPFKKKEARQEERSYEKLPLLPSKASLT